MFEAPPSVRRVVKVLLVGTLTGVVVVAGVLVVVPALGFEGRACVLGSLAATATIWTPDVLVNAPDGGSVGWTATDVGWDIWSGSLEVGGFPGLPLGSSLGPDGSTNATGIWGGLTLATWDFYHVFNESVTAAGGLPCTQAYMAERTLTTPCGVSGLLTSLALSNNTSDLIQPHYVPPSSCNFGHQTPGATAWFDTAYESQRLGSHRESEQLSLCSRSASQPLNITVEGPAQYPFSVSMNVSGNLVSSSGLVQWFAQGGGSVQTAFYSLPGGYVWNVSLVTPGTLPSIQDPVANSLLAFERQAC